MASFEKRPGGWSVRFRTMTEAGEKQKRLSGYKTKAEANRAMIAYLASSTPQEEPREKEQGMVLFEDLAYRWMEGVRARTKVSTSMDFSSRLENHILPTFGKERIADITPAMILDWQNSFSRFSFSYRKTLRTTLASIFKFGERYYDVKNVMLRVEPLRNTERKKEMSFWTPEEFAKFIACVNGEKYRTFFRFLYISGCRKGEALALAPSDIDPITRTVKISKSVSYKTGTGTYAVTSPKNEASNRKLEIPGALLSKMLANKDAAFVFGGDSPFSATQIDRVFAEAVARAGVKRIRIHDLRHSCASLLISQNVSIVAVSKRLGHSDIEQTLNTYSHIMPKDEERIIRIMETVIS